MHPRDLEFEDNVKGVYDARKITKKGENNADKEFSIAATFEEDTKGWQNYGEDDLDNV